MSFSTVLNALSHRILSFDNCSHYLTTPVPRIITHRITDTVDLVSFVYLQFVKNKCVVPWFLFELQKCFTLSFVLHTLTFFTNILLLEFNNPDNGCNALSKKTILIAKQEGNDVLVQVKANQEKLLNNCITTVALTKPQSILEGAVEKSHGRIEKRDARIYENLRYSAETQWKELIACVGVVERSRELFNLTSDQWEKSNETAYYICSAKITAQELNTISRKHWSIENCNHYVRDVSLHEDKNTSKKKPGILARMRSFALNILRRKNKKNIRQTLYENNLNIDILM